jgi:uncharacterized membrane protein
METTPSANSQGKNIAIIAYITFIGWIIALVMNGNEKSAFASFHIRQMLGLILFSLVSVIPIVGWVLWVGVFVFWIMGLISAINGEMKPVPIVGESFQEWFKGLG